MISVVRENAVEVGADAILFSTNECLYLSGGFGGDLIGKYGQAIQEELLRQLRKDERRFGEVGEVFEFRFEGTLWKHHFASIAVDPFYHSSEEIVKGILADVFVTLEMKGTVGSLVTTALGCGFGDLTLPGFVDCLCEEYGRHDWPFEVVLANPDAEYFGVCVERLRANGVE